MQLSPLQQKPNFNMKWYFHLIYITAAVETIMKFCPCISCSSTEGGGLRGSGEIEFNVYSLHDVTVAYLFDTAWMFAYLKVHIHFFILSSAVHHTRTQILVFVNIDGRLYLPPDLVGLCQDTCSFCKPRFALHSRRVHRGTTVLRMQLDLKPMPSNTLRLFCKWCRRYRVKGNTGQWASELDKWILMCLKYIGKCDPLEGGT
jgi:hypothetical protein